MAGQRTRKIVRSEGARDPEQFLDEERREGERRQGDRRLDSVAVEDERRSGKPRRGDARRRGRKGGS
jgi:hypothetical protein